MKAKIVILSIMTFLLSACATTPQEDFSDSFFTYLNPEGKKYFSYILTLKGAQKAKSYLRQATDTDKIRPNQRQKLEQEPTYRPENPEDEKVSLKFRMEELAHKNLEQELENSNYCTNGKKYEKEFFKQFRYHIKGYCI